MFTKIYRIWRREGARGFYARLRYPRRAAAPIPPLSLPFRINGGSGDQRADLAQALRLVLGDRAVSATGGALIRIDPEAEQVGPDDILLLTSAVQVAQLCKARVDLARVTSILLTEPAGIGRLEAAGVARDRIFVIAAAAGQAALAAGLSRWLIAAGLLDPAKLDPALFPALSNLRPKARLCLGLPEATARRAAFLSRNLPDYAVFDGVRLVPGWIGCGWSYASMARAALQQNAVPLTIAEDDLAPPPDFLPRLAVVEDYLNGADWDIFSGLLSDISEDAAISHVETREGVTFIHLDFATGMVFNLYNRRVLAHLAEWRPERGGPEVNTIDAWLSQLPDLKVVTTLPFLAGHDEDMTSTVFGFSNRRYESTIRSSAVRLQKKVDEFRRASRNTDAPI